MIQLDHLPASAFGSASNIDRSLASKSSGTTVDGVLEIHVDGRNGKYQGWATP